MISTAPHHAVGVLVVTPTHYRPANASGSASIHEPLPGLSVDSGTIGSVVFAAWLATGYNLGMKYRLQALL